LYTARFLKDWEMIALDFKPSRVATAPQRVAELGSQPHPKRLGNEPSLPGTNKITQVTCVWFIERGTTRLQRLNGSFVKNHK
jgi:hypothetical protein